MKKIRIIALAVIMMLAAAGCSDRLWFPKEPVDNSESNGGKRLSYDLDGDKRPDYFEFIGGDGLKKVIAYDFNNDGEPDSFIDLDAIPINRCRHLVIILDGIPYDLVKEMYDQGHFRFFHPPSRVISPFPGMTDVCVGEALGHVPSFAYEALYYDRRKKRLKGGNWDYMRAKNEPWVAEIDYRGPVLLDTVSYVSPWQVMKIHVSQVHSIFMKKTRMELITYFVASAGMGTTNGREGRIRCLKLIERLVGQVMCETRGLAKVTMFADHGHAGKPFKSAGLTRYMKKKGWRVTGRLKGPKDVVQIKFGLVTMSAMYTHSAPELAADLAGHDSVELVAYMAPRAVCVKSREGEAIIRKKNGNYSYEAKSGDPLRLNPIIAELKKAGKVDSEGFIDDRALFDATVTHYYPDPLRRLWRSFYSTVDSVPDLLVSLKDGYHAGAGGFTLFVRKTSTHGSLNYKNTVTFIMSTAGPLPKAIRTDEIPKEMSKLFGRPFPYLR